MSKECFSDCPNAGPLEHLRDEVARLKADYENAPGYDERVLRARVTSLEVALREMLSHHAALCGRPNSCVYELNARAALSTERGEVEVPLKRSEEWWLSRARREGDDTIGAGAVARDPEPALSPLEVEELEEWLENANEVYRRAVLAAVRRQPGPPASGAPVEHRMGEGPCGDCGKPRTSPVHATSMGGLIGPTHPFRAWGQGPSEPASGAPVYHRPVYNHITEQKEVWNETMNRWEPVTAATKHDHTNDSGDCHACLGLGYHECGDNTCGAEGAPCRECGGKGTMRRTGCPDEACPTCSVK